MNIPGWNLGDRLKKVNKKYAMVSQRIKAQPFTFMDL